MVGLRRVSTPIGRRPISCAIHLWVFFFSKKVAISCDFVWDLLNDPLLSHTQPIVCAATVTVTMYNLHDMNVGKKRKTQPKPA